MSELKQTVLVAGASSLAGAPVVQPGVGTTLVFEVVLEVTAATLQGSVTFGGGLTEFSSYPLFAVGQGLSQITQLPAGFTLPSPFSMLTINNPGVGRHCVLVKTTVLAPRIVQANWNYTSGGGDVKCAITAWGFGLGTTP